MTELKKVLSFKVILLITINSIMGTGIFFLPALGAKHAGPASLISWAILSIISIYIAMCFAELTSMFPKEGGIYEFCKQAYGRFWSFIIGWGTLIAGNITIAMLVVGAIQYLIPGQIIWAQILFSLTFIFIFNFIAYHGMKTSSVMLVTFAFITIGTLLALIIPGLISFKTSTLSPFFVFPVSSIMVTIFLVAETFFGWETSTFLAAETKDGAKVMPKALIYGTIIIAVISLLFVITSLGAIPWQAFGESSAPLSDLAAVHFGATGSTIFTLLVYLAIIGSVAGWIIAAPRLILAMAKDKLFLPQFAKIHPKYYTPHKAIILQTIISSILVFIAAGSYLTLLHLLVPIVLIMYSAVLFSLTLLRDKKPHLKRYYKVPFARVGPLVVILFNLFLLVMWVRETAGAAHILRLGASLIFVGLPIYFLLEMYYNPKAVRKTNNILAYVALFTERLMLPVKVRKEIIKLVGNIHGKTVLEFGCSVGTLTMHLAEEVGKKGRIYATDICERDISITKKRMRKRGHNHITLLHDPQHHKRVHPDVPNVHVIVSVGMLGYVQEPVKVLTQMNKLLKKGARICFVDYNKFFDIIPNIDWLSDNKAIKELFNKCGFDVKIERKQGFAWKYIYIYGKKMRNI